MSASLSLLTYCPSPFFISSELILYFANVILSDQIHDCHIGRLSSRSSMSCMLFCWSLNNKRRKCGNAFLCLNAFLIQIDRITVCGENNKGDLTWINQWAMHPRLVSGNGYIGLYSFIISFLWLKASSHHVLLLPQRLTSDLIILPSDDVHHNPPPPHSPDRPPAAP